MEEVRKVANQIKEEIAEEKAAQEEKTTEVAKKEPVSLTNLYGSNVNLGTEEVGIQDVNTPTLKVVQATSTNINAPRLGSLYRTDMQEQMDDAYVNFVYVTTRESENYNRTAKEIQKIYFGFFTGTKEPFKMFLRGWGVSAHRALQTQIAHIKSKYKVPMLALTIRVSTRPQEGVITSEDGRGKPYRVYAPVFTIEKTESGTPYIEENPERIAFLIEAASKFKGLAMSDVELSESEHDEDQNDIPTNQSLPNEDVNPDDVPF